MGIVGSVEPHDVVIPIFHPNSTEKTAISSFLFRLDIDYQTTNFAKEFPSHKCEIVVLLLEIIIENDHLGKAKRQELHRIEACEFAHKPAAKSRLPQERAILGAILHLEATEEVIVARRNISQIIIRLHVLDVSLY